MAGAARPGEPSRGERRKRTSRSLKGRLQKALPQVRQLFNEGDGPAAERLLDAMLQESPDHVQALYLMGRTLRALKRFDEAESQVP